MKTEENIVWVEVSRYCMPWHGEYQICKVKVESAILWLRLKEMKVILRYPTMTYKDEPDKSERWLPSYFGFESEEDAAYFKLCFDI